MSTPTGCSGFTTLSEDEVAMISVGIFAKPPLPGKVKTRLIPDIGATRATRVYRYCLEYTLAVVRQSGLDYQLFKSVSKAREIDKWKLLNGKEPDLSFPGIEVPNIRFVLSKGWR